MSSLLAGLLALVAYGSTAAAAPSCKASDLSISPIFGLEILETLATPVTSWDAWDAPLPVSPPLPFDPNSPIDFCNVTVTYTHPGLHDAVHVNIWLPLTAAAWNGRFLGQGGGGWQAGQAEHNGPGVALGYAAAGTDAGHDAHGDKFETMLSSRRWSLASPGNVDIVLLQNFAHRALDDMTRIAKAVVQRYYGTPAKHSYFHGCSTGGRQGLMMAQRYPEHYDGILSAAPAIHFAYFVAAEFWPHVIMNKLKYYPPACELDAITRAAIEACDELDGVKDGLVAAPGLCKFDARTVVGQKFDCDGEQRKISEQAAEIAHAVWEGPIKDGKPLWFGISHEASLPGVGPYGLALAKTICDDKNRNCQSAPFPISADWIRQIVLKDPDFDLSTITEEKFFAILDASRQEYKSIIDTSDPDLRAFQKAGGKIVAWHGLADTVIAANATSMYYKNVAAISPDIQDFFRLFEVPGIMHCAGGPGAFPSDIFNDLVSWVEEGAAPASVSAQTTPSSAAKSVKTRLLCPYPQVAAFKGGDPDLASSFACADSFDAFVQKHDEL